MTGCVPGFQMCVFLMAVIHTVSTKRRHLPSRRRRASIAAVMRLAVLARVTFVLQAPLFVVNLSK